MDICGGVWNAHVYWSRRRGFINTLHNVIEILINLNAMTVIFAQGFRTKSSATLCENEKIMHAFT